MFAGFEIISLVALLMISGFCSGSESALFSLTRFEVQRISLKNRSSAKHILALLKTPGRTLIAILAFNMVVNISATTIATGVFFKFFGGKGVLIAMATMTASILVFGEIIPKVVAVEHNEFWASHFSPIIDVFKYITFPLTVVLRRLQTIFIGGQKEDDLRLGEVDIRSTLEIAHREGVLGSQSKDLLLHILSLDRIFVKDAMIPRANLQIFSESTSRDDLFRFFRMNTDRFVLVAKDEMLQPKILRRKTILNDLENTQIKQLIEEPFFVPENKPLSELFTEIRNGQATSEIVAIDEHGSVVGAMSQRTVLEMVFNEPLLRGKEAQAQFSRIGDSYLLQGSLTLSEFNEIFDAEFRSKYSTTIAGFLTEIFGEIPNAGKSIDIGGFRFRIIHSTIRRIERIAVKRIEA